MKPRSSILLVLSFIVLSPVVLAADPPGGGPGSITLLPGQNTDTNTGTTTTTTTTSSSSTTTTTSSSSSTPTTDPASTPSTPPPPTGPTGPSTPTDSLPTGTPGQTLAGTDTTVQVITPPASSAGPPTASTSSQPDNDSNSGFGTGSIIGLSVAGGVALLGLIGFFVWKFTRKSRSDFDDNEAIKWPELNAHGGNELQSHPLPVNNTGRSGFDTGSDGELSRAPSTTGDYSTSVSNLSDPYAVPPLPHMNPNQPYRDDPSSGYYDPYRGPVPNQFHESGEAIAMTQMSAGNGRMSPGPNVAYDGGRSMTPVASPGRASPGPQAAYAAGIDQYGRSSPALQNPYGVPPQAGRASPGPQQAYGRSSPGPQAAYDPYGQRI